MCFFYAVIVADVQAPYLQYAGLLVLSTFEIGDPAKHPTPLTYFARLGVLYRGTRLAIYSCQQ